VQVFTSLAVTVSVFFLDSLVRSFDCVMLVKLMEIRMESDGFCELLRKAIYKHYGAT
jgi:hypothetical protein